MVPESERVVLRRLSIFPASFTLEAAIAIIADADILASDVVQCVANLVSKSLVAADVGGAGVRYWLLETTRAYARNSPSTLSSNKLHGGTRNTTGTSVVKPGPNGRQAGGRIAGGLWPPDR